MSEQISVMLDAEELQQRFLDDLRERVAWQSRVADERRAAERARPPAIDVLDIATLRRLVESHPDSPRNAEWRVLLCELEPIAETGRLPEMLERLVTVVFAELL